MKTCIDNAYGDPERVKCVRAWSKEAKARTQEANYRDSLANNAEITVQLGRNIENALTSINNAPGILKAATGSY